MKAIFLLIALIAVQGCGNKEKKSSVTEKQQNANPITEMDPVDLSDSSILFSDFEPRKGHRIIWGPGADVDSGYLCYEGDYRKKKLANQITYRLKIIEDSDSYIVRLTAYNIREESYLEKPTPRTPNVGKPRDEICNGKVIASSYVGHEATLELYLSKQNSGVLPALDEILADTPEDREKLKQVYGPMIKSLNTMAHSRMMHIPFFGSDTYKDVDRTDPVGILMAAMKAAKTMEAKRSTNINIFRLADSL